MKNAELFQIIKATPPRGQLAIDGGVKAAVFAQHAAECAHQRHIGDDVDHFAVDRRCLGGEILVQRTS